MAVTLTEEDITAIAQEVINLITAGAVESTDYGDESPMSVPDSDDEKANYYLGVVYDNGVVAERKAGNMSILNMYDSFAGEAVENVDAHVEEKKSELDSYVEDTSKAAIDSYVEDTVEPQLQEYVTQAAGSASEAASSASGAASSATKAASSEATVESLLEQVRQLKSQIEEIAQEKVVAPITIEGEMYGASLHTNGGDVFLDISEIETGEESA